MGLGVVKCDERPSWPSLVALFADPLFARYAVCRARMYLPMFQAIEAVEQDLKALIHKHRSDELWDQACTVIQQHLRACVTRAIHEHLPTDRQDQALADLAGDSFERFIASPN